MTLIKAEKGEKSAFNLRFSVDAETFEKAVNQVYRRRVGRLDIPGFRRGKAPRSVVERMYGKDVFLEDAVSEVLPDAYQAALAESGVKPVAHASFTVESAGADGAVFLASVPVRPEVTVGQYLGIEAERHVEPVKDEEVDAYIQSAREDNGREIEITDEPAAEGMTVILDWDRLKDGALIAGSQVTGVRITLGANAPYPTIAAQTVGHRPGDVFHVRIDREDAPERRKGALTYRVTLQRIVRVELPDLDDSFAQEVSEFNTFAEYREDLASTIRKQHEEKAERRFENRIARILVRRLGGEEIPEALFEDETETRLREFEESLAAEGIDLERYCRFTGQNEDSLKARCRRESEDHVRLRLAIDRIAELEHIEASPEEMEAQIARYAKEERMDIDAMRERLDPDGVARVVRSQKVMELLKAAATRPVRQTFRGSALTAPGRRAPSWRNDARLQRKPRRLQPVRRLSAQRKEKETEE